MVSGEEADAVLDWLRAVRRALASGTGAAMAVPPAFGKPVDVPFDALDCYPGAESSVIVMDGERIEGDWVSDGEGASFVGDRGGDLARVDLLWGVDVSWKRGLVFNARIESALSGSGLWSEAVENGRCIVPVRAFYETRNVDGGTGGRKPADIGSRVRAVRRFCWRDCVWATASCWSPASPTPWWGAFTAACPSR